VSGQYQLPATVGGSVSGQYQLPATLASLGVRIDLPARHGVHLEQVDQRWELPCGNSVQWWVREASCSLTVLHPCSYATCRGEICNCRLTIKM
jgi:hypothetical protein